MPSPHASAELTLCFSHRIFYKTENPVPAEEIAEALMALSRVVQRSPAVMKRLVPGISVPTVELLVEKLESGSLTEDFIVKFFFGSQKKMDRAIKRFREALGVDLTSKAGVVRTIVWALVIYGAYYAITHSDKPAKPTVEIGHNTIINVGAAEMNMTPDQLVKVIEAAVGNKNQLASDAVKVIRPAKTDPKAEIIVDGNSDLAVTNKVIVQVPSEFKPDKSEESKVVEHTEIRLRALDLDSSEHGWAAVVLAFSPRRLPMAIDPAINSDDLFGKKIVHGTIEALSRRDQYGRLQLRGYRLVALDAEKP
ncbi:MAG: hypothetical protein WC485_11000 [Opitutaceae bacterium]